MGAFKKLLILVAMFHMASDVYAAEEQKSGDREMRSSDALNSFKADLENKIKALREQAKIEKQGKNDALVQNSYNEMESEVNEIPEHGRGILRLTKKLTDLKDKFRSFVKLYGKDLHAENINFIEMALLHAKSANLMMDGDVLKLLYKLLYVYVELPGSVVKLKIESSS